MNSRLLLPSAVRALDRNRLAPAAGSNACATRLWTWAVASLLLWALACIGAGCTGRDRQNPFDPENPLTGGEPVGVSVVAGCGEVSLSWGDPRLVDLMGTRIWRGEGPAGEDLGRLLTTEALAPETLVFTDSAVVNTVLYNYTVEFLFEGDDHGLLAPVETEPGGGVPWVGDPCGWGLARLSHDGRRLQERLLTSAMITDVEIDPSTHLLYAAQVDGDRVVVLDSRSGLYLTEYAVNGASGLDWSAAENLLVVAGYYEQEVTWITLNGTRSRLSAQSYPEAVALRDSSLTWIALEDGTVLQQNLHTGVARDTGAELLRAVALADDALGGGCWVADREGGTVVYIADEGTIMRSAEGVVLEPIDLCATGDGVCLVADLTGGTIVELNRACEETRRWVNLGRVAEVTFDPYGGAIWASVPDDGLVMRILPDDSRVTLQLAGCPRRLAGDWLGGCP